MSSTDLIFFVQLNIKSERVDEWMRAVTELIDHMSREDTFVMCLMDQSAEDPTIFTLYERWNEPSLDAFVINQMKDYRKRYEELLPELLRRPRRTMILSPLRTWQRSDS